MSNTRPTKRAIAKPTNPLLVHPDEIDKAASALPFEKEIQIARDLLTIAGAAIDRVEKLFETKVYRAATVDFSLTTALNRKVARLVDIHHRGFQVAMKRLEEKSKGKLRKEFARLAREVMK